MSMITFEKRLVIKWRKKIHCQSSSNCKTIPLTLKCITAHFAGLAQIKGVGIKLVLWAQISHEMIRSCFPRVSKMLYLSHITGRKTLFKNAIIMNVVHNMFHLVIYIILVQGSSWYWWHDSWIYNYLCNQCLSPQTLWVRIPLMRVYSIQHIVISLSGTCNRSVFFFGFPIKQIATI